VKERDPLKMENTIGLHHLNCLIAAEKLVSDLAAHAKFQYEDKKWAMNAEYWVDRARKLIKGEK
jgi:hypothetical protein